MPLFEYFCDHCQAKFEELTSRDNPEAGKCPKCHGKSSRKLLSRFAVGGQGDLRESTLHGCHDCPVGPAPGGAVCGSGGCHDH